MNTISEMSLSEQLSRIIATKCLLFETPKNHRITLISNIYHR